MMFGDREFDPYLDVRDLAAPPELDDDDFCRSMWDPTEGWLES